MERGELRKRVDKALSEVAHRDLYLLENNLGERCIASRLAMYLQAEFPDYSVDTEYNRHGALPKRVGLPEDCANYRDEAGEALVVPDVIVHTRGPDGPNLLVLEIKKTTNPEPCDWDRARVQAFREQLGYTFGALVECETRPGHKPGIRVVEWFGD